MKILVLTSIYPQSDDEKCVGVTPVVHYFTKEWAKDNHEIVVIHNANKYPLPFYLLPKKIIGKVNSKIGTALPNYNQRKSLFGIKDDVKVYRVPITKLLPKGKFLSYQINNQYKNIVNILMNKENNFTPDIVVGHWENPQIQLISMLKKQFNCRTALVLHGVFYLNRSKFKKWIKKYMNDIDIIGCRSNNIADEAQKLLSLNKKPFICYSGIPDKYVEKNIVNNININDRSNIDTYVYVGRLIERKNVDTIIRALNIAYPKKDFIFNIVGVGAKEQELLRLVNDLNLQSNIKFLGVLSREEVVQIMNRSKYFTMVSKDEAFGLVYLEALSCGCIVVASKNEGIDGVIIDKKNGFLCEAGNTNKLARLYLDIKKLSTEQLLEISNNALETAKQFTDMKVANKYLDEISKEL